MLNELSVIFRQVQEEIFDLYNHHITLSDDFCSVFRDFIRNKHINDYADILFYKDVALITTQKKKFLFVPTMGFVIALKLCKYYTELYKYKTAIMGLVDGNQNLKEGLKNKETKQISLLIDASTAYTPEEKEYLKTFIKDYNWWGGGKTIDRADYYVSPMMKCASLLAETQSEIAELSVILHDNPFIKDSLQYKKEDVDTITSIPTNKSHSATGSNVILYGVPGAGKSYTIDNKYKTEGCIVKRVVFHPDYTYSDFVGQLLPDTDEGGRVKYKFVPGPFTEILKSAHKNKDKNHLFIIEEINRGNAPSIFGDLFQLLDRKDDGSSMYGINNKDMAKEIYGISDTDLAKEENDSKYQITIPGNLSIIATMNTSDQNVFTLDTAFQRRWEMRLIENRFTGEHKYADKNILDTGVTWRTFCEVVNKIVVENSSSTASTEDKRLGVYFVKEEFLDMGDSRQIHRFPEKVIKYLWDDAFKFNREAIFTSDYHSLEDIIRVFVEKSGFSRFDIFNENIRNDFRASGDNRNSLL